MRSRVDDVEVSPLERSDTPLSCGRAALARSICVFPEPNVRPRPALGGFTSCGPRNSQFGCLEVPPF